MVQLGFMNYIIYFIPSIQNPEGSHLYACLADSRRHGQDQQKNIVTLVALLDGHQRVVPLIQKFGHLFCFKRLGVNLGMRMDHEDQISSSKTLGAQCDVTIWFVWMRLHKFHIYLWWWGCQIRTVTGFGPRSAFACSLPRCDPPFHASKVI